MPAAWGRIQVPRVRAQSPHGPCLEAEERRSLRGRVLGEGVVTARGKRRSGQGALLCCKR